MRSAIQSFLLGLLAMWSLWLVLLFFGLILAGAHQERAPVRARVQQEVVQRERKEVLAGEEEQRQKEYAAHPGAPEPTATFNP